MPTTWATVSTPSTGGNPINDICCAGDGIFVAVGTGVVLNSIDAGQTWVSQTPAQANTWRGVAFNGSILVAVSSNGANRVMTSTDSGVTWTARTAAEANAWQSVTWAAFLGLFVAVSSGGVNRVMTSPDGITWTARAASSAKAWSHVASSDALVMAYEITTETTMTSADAVTWTDGATGPSAFNLNISGGSNQFVYSAAAGQFAAAGRDTGTLTAKVVLTPDSAAWTSETDAPLSDFDWFQGAFFAADSLGGFIGWLQEDVLDPSSPYIGMSVDGGATWTAEDTTFDGSWSVGAWDPSSGTAVFWDGDITDTMLVGVVSVLAEVTSVVPASGTTFGGTAVTIRGEGFSSATGVVTFGGLVATDVVIVSDTVITAVTPQHDSGAVDVEVIGVDTLTAGYTYTIAQAKLPPIPYPSPVQARPDENGKISNPWFLWLTTLKERVEGLPGSVPAESIIGVLNPDTIPELPFTRIQMTGRRLLGRSSPDTGDTEEIQVAAGLTLAGGVLSLTGLPGGYTIGDLLYADSANSLALLNDVAAGSYLRSGGVATAPVWSTLKLPNTATTGDLPYASAANTVSMLADVAAGSYLRSGGVGTAPLWSTLILPNAVTAGSVVFASATNTYGQDNSNLFWDDTNNRLGIGTASPGYPVTIAGNLYSAIPNVLGTDGENIILHNNANASEDVYISHHNSIFEITGSLVGRVFQAGLNSSAFALHIGLAGVAANSTFAVNINPGLGGLGVDNVRSQTGNPLLLGTQSFGEVARIPSAGVGILIGTTTSPGSGTAALVFGDGTALASMGSNTAGLYADDVGGTVEQFAINEANELTRLTGLPSRNSAQFDAAATTTLSNVTGLTRNVAAGVTYRFEAVLFVTADGVGGSKFAIAGTATATAIIYDILLLDEGTNAYTITSRQTALAGAAGQVGTTSGLCRIVGTIVVNAAGTLTVQFAQNVASGTSSIVANSTFVIQQAP